MGRPVSVPRIGADGSLQIQIYHPMVQTVDHIEYEPTPLTQGEATKSVFDQFQVPIEHEIIHYAPIKEAKRVILPKKKEEIKMKIAIARKQGKKRKFEASVS